MTFYVVQWNTIGMNFIMFPNLLGGGLTDFGADPDGVESA